MTVKDRGGPFQNLNLLNRVNVGAGRIIAAKQFLNGVAIARDAEATGEREVTPCGKAIRLGGHTRDIGQRISETQRPLVDEHVRRFDRQRSCGLNDGRFVLCRAERTCRARDDHGLLTALIVAALCQCRRRGSHADNKRDSADCANLRNTHDVTSRKQM